jgi:hypothetical protein
MDDNQWHQHDIMGVIIKELHNSWKLVVLIKLQLSYNELHHIYGDLQLCKSCKICSLTLTTHKYNEFQVSFATQRLSCKANCKTPLFLIMFKCLLWNPSTLQIN